MVNYLMSVAGLSAAGSLFVRGETSAPSTWAWAALAGLALVLVFRTFARGVFATERRSVRGR